jgi:aspartate carbamoyltransferase catalytic subunit
MVSRFRGQDILSSEQFDLSALDEIFSVVDRCVPIANGSLKTDVLSGAVLGSLFFEASTRTRLSFDAAFMRLGGSVSATTGVTFSSIVKGESIKDTGRVVGGYFDICVFRHAHEAALEEFAHASEVPVINAGNGAGEHPTQALLDIYTIHKEFGKRKKRIEGSCIVLAGDLRYGRTVHSLAKLLSLYGAAEIRLVSPRGLRLPEVIEEKLRDSGHKVSIFSSLEEGLLSSDLVYMTRVQKERIPLAERADHECESFVLDRKLADKVMKKDCVIMHPLPRDSSAGAHDLSDDMDDDDRIAIFRQSDAGVPVRMALFACVLGVEDELEKSSVSPKWTKVRSRL